jgi:hypothetical protein
MAGSASGSYGSGGGERSAVIKKKLLNSKPKTNTEAKIQ